MKFSLIVLAVFMQLVALSVQETASGKSSVSDGKPVKCYVCNENTDERCKDPFKGDSNLISECSSEEKSCRKITQTGKKTTFSCNLFLKQVDLNDLI